VAGEALQPDRRRRRIDLGPDADGGTLTSLPRAERNTPVQRAEIPIAEFVERVFVPEHVALKKLSGRTHYHAILKHILEPEELEGVFEADAANWRTRFKSVPNWPHLGALRPCNAGAHHVQRLISAALGRATQAESLSAGCGMSGCAPRGGNVPRLFGGNPSMDAAATGLP
jgi:hypothetical protein